MVMAGRRWGEEAGCDRRVMLVKEEVEKLGLVEVREGDKGLVVSGTMAPSTGPGPGHEISGPKLNQGQTQ